MAEPTERDIWLGAERFIKQFGDGATVIVKQCAKHSAQKGDKNSADIFVQILGTIAKVETTSRAVN
jgi:predicted lipoprotein